jgi:hypothetical protein
MRDQGTRAEQEEARAKRVKHWVAVLGTVFAATGVVFTIYWSIRTERKSGPPACTVELTGVDGMPLKGSVVGPSGESRQMDLRGVIDVPCTWEGASVSVREPVTHREIATILISWTRGHQRVTVH